MQKLIGRAHHKFLNSLGNAMKKKEFQHKLVLIIMLEMGEKSGGVPWHSVMIVRKFSRII